jgi:hypothetical protein
MKTTLNTPLAMRLKNNFLQNMCFLFWMFSGMAFAQPAINNPTPYRVCDENNNGHGYFYLNTKNAEILQTLNSLDYSISYHLYLTDAQQELNPINLQYGISNDSQYFQTVYVRVWENSTPTNFALTTLDLIVNPLPIANSVQNIIQSDIPFDGHATFDLTSRTAPILGSQSNVSINYYYASFYGAGNNYSATPISIPSTYVNQSNPEMIVAEVTDNITNCKKTTTFNLVLTNPNILNITDAYFKHQLVSSQNTSNFLDLSGNSIITVDTNGDGEIQVSEAQQIAEIGINGSNLISLEGINSFINLKKIYVYGCYHISELNLNGLSQLTELWIYNGSLSNLILSNLPNLLKLGCNNNNVTNLDLHQITSLKEIRCQENWTSNINLSGLTQLELLNCSSNSLSNINLNGLNNLSTLICDGNTISILDLSGNPNLHILKCGRNSIPTLDLSGNPSLVELECNGCYLQTLDVSSLHNLILLKISENSQLTHLNLKNGVSYYANFSGNLQIFGNNNLQFVCCDSFNIDTISNAFNDYDIVPHFVVNSYCTFTPGGNYNTITGSMLFDGNNNGCDATDLPQPNIRININDGTTQGATFTNNTGNYNFYTQNGSFVLTPDTENPTWFNFSPPTATITFTDNNNNTDNQNFCITANGIHTDVEVVIEPITTARPGFTAVYKIVYKNKGNQPISANVNFNYNDTVLDFVSATVAPSTQTTGVLNFGFSNLLPFENRSFYITLHVNAPTDSPAINIGDVLDFNAAILNIGDENPSDNTFTYNQTVVGSFDPNNITCLEGDIAPLSNIGSYLHYGVNFENTGTYPAENIVVKTIIDTTKYDINSLQMLNTSNPAYTRITGNVVEFIFKHIMLDTGGHGNVLFKVRTLNSLVNGDMVSREAGIFFDYNAPVSTGNANTTFQTLNNGQFVLDNSILISPNPTSSFVNIKGRSAIKSIQVYDIQGRLLETKLIEEVATTIDFSDKTNGIYFFKITTENGSKVEKIIKE